MRLNGSIDQAAAFPTCSSESQRSRALIPSQQYLAHEVTKRPRLFSSSLKTMAPPFLLLAASAAGQAQRKFRAPARTIAVLTFLMAGRIGWMLVVVVEAGGVSLAPVSYWSFVVPAEGGFFFALVIVLFVLSKKTCPNPRSLFINITSIIYSYHAAVAPPSCWFCSCCCSCCAKIENLLLPCTSTRTRPHTRTHSEGLGGLRSKKEGEGRGLRWYLPTMYVQQ